MENRTLKIEIEDRNKEIM